MKNKTLVTFLVVLAAIAVVLTFYFLKPQTIRINKSSQTNIEEISTSDNLEQIEKDLNSTDFQNLETELKNLEAELSY